MPEASEQNGLQKISRRSFLKMLGLAGGGLLLGAVGDSLSGGPVSRTVIDLAISSADLLESRIESERDSSRDIATIESRELLVDQPEKFKIERLTVRLGPRNKIVKPVLATFGGESNCEIVQPKDNRRENLLFNLNAVLVCPIGYVTGNYHFEEIGKNSNVNLLLSGRTSAGKNLGPSQIVDRFPGLDEEVNQASGGIYVAKNKLVLANKSQLLEADAAGEAFLQMPMYFDNNNKDQILKLLWQHFGTKEKIGNTAYWWGAYLGYSEDGQTKVSCLVFDREMVSIWQMVKITEQLADDKKFKMVLTDAGSGSSILVQQADLPRKREAYGLNGFEIHSSPVAVLIN